MFPPTVTLKPAASRIRPVSAVVVDFPFVPVMATMRPRSQRDASSSSPMIGTPRSRALSGRTADRAARRGSARRDPHPSTSRSVAAELELHAETSQRLCLRHLGPHLGQRHLARRRASSSAAAIPLRAAPATVTRFPCTSNSPATVPHAHPPSPHRSLSVVRLNNAKMIPTMTKREITLGSLQPIASK